MGPQSRPVEFNSSERPPRRGLPADPHGTAPRRAAGRRRAPFPRGERHDRSVGSHKSRGKVAGVRTFAVRPRVTVPLFGGLPANRGIACRRFRLTPPAPVAARQNGGRPGSITGQGAGPRVARPGRGWTVHSVSRLPGLAADLNDLRVFSAPVAALVSRRLGGASRGEEAQGPWRIDRHPIRPVLKHGPRSLTCARVIGLYETQRRNESEGRSRSVRGRIRATAPLRKGLRARRTAGPSRPPRR